MRSYSSREVLKMLLDDGWYPVDGKDGSHRQFKHPTKPGKTTLKFPQKDIPRRTLDNISKQSGIKFE